MAVIIAAGITASLAIAAFFPKSTPFVPPVLPTPIDAVAAAQAAFADATSFPSKEYRLEEGYTIQVVDGWELVSHTPDRRVDRYRFERKEGGHIFTMSVYDRQQTPDFDALITARYGASLLRDQLDVTVAGLNAKRVTADFLDMGATMDVLVQVNDDTFISLYGVRQVDAEESATVAKEMNFMQKSFSPAR